MAGAFRSFRVSSNETMKYIFYRADISVYDIIG